MDSADTLCKKLLGVKSAVVTGHDFYQDSDGLNHLRIHARPSKRHENDWSILPSTLQLLRYSDTFSPYLAFP